MSKIETRTNVTTSIQIGFIGEVSAVPFKLDLGFNVKNDSDEPVELEVNLISMPEGEYVTTSFSPGWNPEIVREIKSGTVTDIKYGY
jgi:hypothetical protein